MEEIAQIYVQIASEIESHQNGIVADGMQRFGIDYKQNFGLSVTQIDKIAGRLSKNNKLAFYCWNQESREAKLLALRLINPKTITKPELDDILSGINNPELAEQAAFYFFVHISDILTLINELLGNGNEFVVYSGLLTIVRFMNINKVPGNEIYSGFLKIIEKTRWPDNLFIKRTLSNVLIKIALIDNTFHLEISQWIDNYRNTNKDFSEHLQTEILNFLN